MAMRTVSKTVNPGSNPGSPVLWLLGGATGLLEKLFQRRTVGTTNLRAPAGEVLWLHRTLPRS
jgi:hypothetical protein